MTKRRAWNTLTPFGKHRENQLHPHCHVCGYPIEHNYRVKGRIYCSQACNMKAYHDKKRSGLEIEYTSHMTDRKGGYCT